MSIVTPVVIDHLQRWEGLRLTAYPDPGSNDGHPWTIGYGHTSDNFMKVVKGMKITKEQAVAALKHDAQEAAVAIDKLVSVPLNDNQRGALISFVFNVGITAFARSTLLKRLNAGNYTAVPEQLMRWNKNDGRVMDGLTNRRAAEAGLWAKGSIVSSRGKKVATPTEVIVPSATKPGLIGVLLGAVLTALAAYFGG